MNSEKEITPNTDSKEEIELEIEDSEEIVSRISELPDDMKTFFGNLDPQTRRIVCSDEGLLERSNEELRSLFDTMISEIEESGEKPLIDTLIKKGETDETNKTENAPESHLDKEDREMVAEWQKKLEKYKSLKISGDIAKDYNEIVKIDEENPENELVDPAEDKQKVLQKLALRVETWRIKMGQSEAAHASPGRETMKSIYIDILRQRHVIGTNFVQYYSIQNTLDKNGK